ncbi:Maltase B1 [Carabus blaptoides fortunei]
MKCVTLLVFFCASALAAPATETKELDEWWKTAVFYQIYPRSYKDSNNDGSGDLEGITQKLTYLKDTGVQAAWLSPVFNSPMVDAGYDISDFRNINPIFGTMEDFDKLVEEANRLGIKIILDFVPNHSSNEHEWFKKSVKKEAPYTDYYVWSDGKVLEDGTRVPPNNWKSLFLGSAWEWNDERQQYYLHQFATAQPDLNYRNPLVVEEMKNVLRFWLNKGVYGYRVDAIPFLFEDTRMLDEPKVDANMPDDEVQYPNLQHIYTMDQDETFDMIYQWRAVLDEFTTDGVSRAMMTEAYTSIENQIRLYGNETHNGASFSFNFILLSDVGKDSNARDFVNAINKWLNALPPQYTSNWVVGNHDNHRTATKHGVGRVDGINMLVMILPGVGVTYNGEEIGMEDGYVSWEQTQDPNAINAGEENYLQYSRDPERTPFHWDDSINAGFNEGTEPWLPVSEKYKQTNLKAQQQADTSHYKIYQQIMKLRHSDVIKKGSYSITSTKDDNVIIVSRSYNGLKYVLVFNVGGTPVDANLETLNKLTVKISSVGSQYAVGTEINENNLKLNAYEALILETSV